MLKSVLSTAQPPHTIFYFQPHFPFLPQTYICRLWILFMLTELIRLTALLPYISCLDRSRARCRREREGGRRNEKKTFNFYAIHMWAHVMLMTIKLTTSECSAPAYFTVTWVVSRVKREINLFCAVSECKKLLLISILSALRVSLERAGGRRRQAAICLVPSACSRSDWYQESNFNFHCGKCVGEGFFVCFTALQSNAN